MRFTVRILVDILPLKKLARKTLGYRMYRFASERTSFSMWGTDSNPGIFSDGDGSLLSKFGYILPAWYSARDAHQPSEDEFPVVY